MTQRRYCEDKPNVDIVKMTQRRYCEDNPNVDIVKITPTLILWR